MELVRSETQNFKVIDGGGEITKVSSWCCKSKWLQALIYEQLLRSEQLRKNAEPLEHDLARVISVGKRIRNVVPLIIPQKFGPIVCCILRNAALETDDMSVHLDISCALESLPEGFRHPELEVDIVGGE